MKAEVVQHDRSVTTLGMNPGFAPAHRSSRPDVPLVVAHRGACRHAAENTVLAAEIAISQGADMIELDVRRTADGVLVVHHDALLHGVPLHDLSYDLVRDIKPDIARLDELLSTAAGRVMLDVELKESGYEETVLDVLTSHVSIQDVVVTSFCRRALVRMKTLEPSMRTGWIVEGPQPADVLSRFARTGADWLVAEAVSLTPFMIARTRSLDVPLVVWTVNLWSEIDSALRIPGVAAIISDLPDVARAMCDRYAAERMELSTSA